MRYLPLADLRGYGPKDFAADGSSALALIFLAVPQGVAYAIIAGLPPAMGLYAAAIPPIVGSLFRSSRFVVTGPTNAVSLLVGSVVAGIGASHGASPVEVGITLALAVGLIQVLAGLLRLDVLVDYISMPVLLGYMTGAAVLIAVGQLPNATGTATTHGDLASRLIAWGASLDEASALAVTFTVGTAIGILGLRRIDRRIPGAIVAMAIATALSFAFGLRGRGLQVVADVAPVPAGFPPVTMPSLSLLPVILSAAVACTVLSLVESSSVARALAARRGDRLDMSAEFTGQGLANLAAAFFGGYPIGGSLSRSVLNERSGARSRVAGMLSGALMLLVLFVLGPLVNETPLASLAGLLFVIAADLVDAARIRITLRGTLGDQLSFGATLLGTWTLPLDQAIYLGVVLSLVLFLRRARLLSMRELAIGERGGFREIEPQLGERARTCRAIRIVNLTGPVFFAMAGELESALDPLIADREIRVLIVRMRQTQLLDVTTLAVLEAASARMAADGRRLLLLGLRAPLLEFLERTGAAARFGRSNLFPLEPGWFSAMSSALRTALALVGPHSCGGSCPFHEYLDRASGPGPA